MLVSGSVPSRCERQIIHRSGVTYCRTVCLQAISSHSLMYVTLQTTGSSGRYFAGGQLCKGKCVRWKKTSLAQVAALTNVMLIVSYRTPKSEMRTEIPCTFALCMQLIVYYYFLTPPKINMSPKKGPSKKDISSSKHQFSGDMLVFRGGTILDLHTMVESNRPSHCYRSGRAIAGGLCTSFRKTGSCHACVIYT